jgi:hypothetical protein
MMRLLEAPAPDSWSNLTTKFMKFCSLRQLHKTQNLINQIMEITTDQEIKGLCMNFSSMVSFFSLFCLTSFLLESSAELALALGRTLVGEELSEREDFLVGEVEGDTCAAIGIMPGMWPPVLQEKKH